MKYNHTAALDWKGYGRRFIDQAIWNCGLDFWAMRFHALQMAAGNDLKAAIFHSSIRDGAPDSDHVGVVSLCQRHTAVLVPVGRCYMGADFILAHIRGWQLDADMLDRSKDQIPPARNASANRP